MIIFLNLNNIYIQTEFVLFKKQSRLTLLDPPMCNVISRLFGLKNSNSLLIDIEYCVEVLQKLET